MYMFDHIALFTKLVEIGSYNKTAEIVRISPPTLTRKIQELESYLNIQLLDRNTRNVTPTTEGELVYLKFKNLVKDLGELVSQFNASQTNNNGRLKIILPLYLPRKLINPYISYFIKTNPGVKISIRYRVNPTDLNEDDFDIIISQHSSNDTRFDYRFLRSEKVNLYCTPSYIQKYGQPTTLEELSQHNLMSGLDPLTDNDYDHIIFTNKYTNEKFFFDAGFSQIRLNSALAAIEVGMSGDCIFGSWGYLCEDAVKTGKLVHVLPEYETLSVDFYMITRKKLTTLEQAFVDFIYRCMNRSIENDVINII